LPDAELDIAWVAQLVGDAMLAFDPGDDLRREVLMGRT